MSDRTDSNLENGPTDSEKSPNSPSVSSDPAESKSQPPPEAPEGGSKAFLSLLGGSLGLFISFGSEISWITSSEFFFMLFASPLSGYLFDNYGPRLPIFPLMVKYLLPEVGFGWTMRICAFLILAIWLITMATIASNLPHGGRKFEISNYTRPFTQPKFLILLGFCYFLYWGLFVPFNYLVISYVGYGMSLNMAFNLIPIMNGASFIGRTVPNVLADRYGRFNVLIIMVFATGVITLALWLPAHSNAALISYAAIFGITSGTCIGLTPPLVMTIFPPREVGFRIGTALAIAGVAALTSPPIAGAIASKSGGSYENSTIFSGVNFMIATAFLIWLRVQVAGWKPTTIA
ncbi:unnamed protein product [Aureobasidium vineae]|uniref:Major facilitator superfamily (MFS) profile domain-containing protein n=1 Tax=Aureobasidium vineae TaxID=2773715 RepID=A0A9N8PAR8_9PEZI|nr:unnamed protein product [Aureobasidium vineae]